MKRNYNYHLYFFMPVYFSVNKQAFIVRKREIRNDY